MARKRGSGRRPAGKRKKRGTKGRSGGNWRRWTVRLTVVAVAALGAYLLYLDRVVTTKFEGKRWSIPSRVYARALELYPGRALDAAALQRELDLIGYRPSWEGDEPGSYLRRGERFTVTTRRFHHWDGEEPARRLEIAFDGPRLAALRDGEGRALALARLEPAQIGMIYPAHREDRLLVRLEELPPHLIDALVTTEDRNFFHHFGIDPRGIARALLANLEAGGVVQGGSTLTQQLVKNFYLSSERTLRRKINEALMALLLELHYSKEEILEAYVNEIYLGQDGGRAIHGFGLAAEFYFGKPVAELDLAEAALLVAIVRGPAWYDPRRHPERALDRRDQIIETLLEQGLIDAEQARLARQSPLGVTPRPRRGRGHYPAFLDLVKRQLRDDYREEDLRSEGLRIFTTLDPLVQQRAEQALATTVATLERRRGLAPGILEGAVVVSRAGSGEISAVVGGRNPRFEGFNRALDIRRPVGSLLKPAIYLEALSRGRTLATKVPDRPLTVELGGGRQWRPENYDRTSHGEVLLIDALAHSYNLAAVGLGLELGVDTVVETLRRLGVGRPLNPYPSLLLGAAELAPLDIAQLYQTLADEGFHTPLRAVREVLDSSGRPLERYPLETAQRFDHATVRLLTHALEEALRRGTGRAVGAALPPELFLAGKTGTTDELRDSWFSGYGAGHVAVVWLGNDDNREIGLTGAAGALPVWSAIMTALERPGQRPPWPEEIEWVTIDAATGLRGGPGCEENRRLPFIEGSAPAAYAPCAGGKARQRLDHWWNSLKEWFR